MSLFSSLRRRPTLNNFASYSFAFLLFCLLTLLPSYSFLDPLLVGAPVHVHMLHMPKSGVTDPEQANII